MKQIAHVMVGLVFGFLLTALTFDTTSRAAQGVVKIQPVRVADGESRIKWWREARFGMFIHWGLYAIPGRREWVQWNEQIAVKEYAKLADIPTAFHVALLADRMACWTKPGCPEASGITGRFQTKLPKL